MFRALERERLLAALRPWASDLLRRHPEVLRVGLFGSYARGDYALGSDADILVLVRSCDQPQWFLRPLAYEVAGLPVGMDLLVYTEAEARRMNEQTRWFRRVLSEVVWLC